MDAEDNSMIVILIWSKVHNVICLGTYYVVLLRRNALGIWVMHNMERMIGDYSGRSTCSGGGQGGGGNRQYNYLSAKREEEPLDLWPSTPH